jgi:hypothetical protein
MTVLMGLLIPVKKLCQNDQQKSKQILREHLQIHLVNLDAEVDEVKKYSIY